MEWGTGVGGGWTKSSPGTLGQACRSTVFMSQGCPCSQAKSARTSDAPNLNGIRSCRLHRLDEPLGIPVGRRAVGQSPLKRHRRFAERLPSLPASHHPRAWGAGAGAKGHSLGLKRRPLSLHDLEARSQGQGAGRAGSFRRLFRASLPASGGSWHSVAVLACRRITLISASSSPGLRLRRVCASAPPLSANLPR